MDEIFGLKFSFTTIFFKLLHEGNMSFFSDATSGWAGWALAHPEFGSSVNPITTRGGQIMPTTLLLAHPDLKTQRQLCYAYISTSARAELANSMVTAVH